MKKLLLILLCFTANFTFATSVTVNNHAALVSAVSGTADTIYIGSGIAVTTTPININRNLVLIGINMPTLYGNNISQIINISGGLNKVEIQNIDFNRGYSYYGGAIALPSIDTLKIINCGFTHCAANWGAAIYGTEIKYLLLEKCNFNNNQALEVGGGIWVGGATTIFGQKTGELYVINCWFVDNAAGDATGALDTHDWKKVTIFNSAFIGNISGSTDPAAICLGNNNQTNMINTTIAKNHTTGNAGGIGLFGSENLNIYNCIFSGNTNGSNRASDIANTPVNSAVSTIKMYNSVYQSIITPFPLSVNVNNFGNVQPNSIFVDFANNNYYLQDGCVAINSGNENDYVTQWNLAFPNRTITSATAHTDLDGRNNRVICSIDMGALENYYPVILPFSDTFCEDTTYNFRGRILTDGGIFYDTIFSTLVDCDTIIKLDLTKLNRIFYAYRDTSYKCEWYYFGNDSINDTGIYIDTLLGQNGCDSIVTLDLLVRPREFDDTLNICIEKLPRTIYDTIFSTTAVSGTYIIHHRCATITLLLNVMPKVETYPPEIPKICADENSFILKFLPTNAPNTTPPTHYEIIFGNVAVPLGFEYFENKSGRIGSDSEIIVQMPEKIYPNYYSCKIILSDSIHYCTLQEFDIEFPVLYPSSIMEQKWDDVIALLNEKTCGYKFVAYQWYQNAKEMVGETASYIYRKLVFGDKYSVLITREDGTQMFSCELTAREPCTDCFPYPQVVQNGSSVKIYVKGKARANLLTVTGVLLQTIQINSPMYELSAPTKGIYLLEILPENKKEGRVVVPILINK